MSASVPAVTVPRERLRAVLRDLWPVLLAGAVLRVLWIYAVHGGFAFVDTGEATKVALSLARGDGFAGAFGDGRPTAHVMPTTPIIAAGVLRLFGPDRWPGQVVLGLWALVQTGAACLLLHRLFGAIGMAERPRRAALVLMCLLPAFVAQEAQDFRYWEGALSVCLAAVNLHLIVSWSGGERIATRLAGVAALSAVTFFVNPAVGVAVDACWAVWAVRHLSLGRCVLMAVLALAALVAVLTPWTVRNARVLGVAVPIRSNFGLELAIGNHAAAVSGLDPDAVFAARLRQIHPYHSARALEAAHAGGEVAYARALQARTMRWIAAHPGDFVRLCVRHGRQFLLPEPWQFQWHGLLGLRSMAVCALNLLGLLGLGVGLARRRRGFGYLALYVVVAALPYLLVQPIPRYTYIVSGVLTFLAVETAMTAVARIRRLRASGAAAALRPAAAS